MGAIYGKYLQENVKEDVKKELKTPSKPILRINDPRSATVGIERTPITISTKEKIIETPVRPYLETDLDEKNTSLTQVFVEKEEISIPQTPDSVDEIEITVQNLEISEAVEKEEEATEENVDEIVWAIKRPPMSLEPQKRHSKRTPLGKICPNSPLSKVLPVTPKNGKQWRNIQDERVRRGLYDPENTPPLSLAPPEEISSAPGKFMRHPLSVWAQENY